MSDQKKSRISEAFFGRRHGKTLRDGQRQRTQTLLPKLKIDLGKAPPTALVDLFDNKVSDVRLEIGFGGGEHLVNEVRCCMDTGFIGVEPFVNGMAKCLALFSVQPHLLGRLRLYDDDATAVLDWLPEQSLSGIDLFYPDPWLKKKHWKRRFINQKNLNRFARVLKSGGRFRFASDIGDYVNWTLLHVKNQGQFIWQAETALDWTTPYQGWSGTRYEAKAVRENRSPAYLSFLRK